MAPKKALNLAKGPKNFIFDLFFLFPDKFWPEKVISYSFINSFKIWYFFIEMRKICGWSLEQCLKSNLNLLSPQYTFLCMQYFKKKFDPFFWLNRSGSGQNQAPACRGGGGSQ